MPRTAGLLALAAACGVSPSARADLWGYVDEKGVTHFATEQRDERYTLFFKGRSSLDAPPPAPSGPDEALQNTRLYRRVAEHPNLRRYAPLIDEHAKAHALDPALVRAIIAVESGFEPTAISPKGAIGLMQVIPATGARYGLAADRQRTLEQKLADPATNLRIGTRYLRDLLARFSNDLTLALAAYNAGEGAVEQYGNRVPPYPETQEYVKLVQQFYALYRPPPPAPKPAGKPRLVLPPRAAPPPAESAQ
ncbi:MAG: lytic transglycosylase domain-containing protein [Burkholderiales bacterium]